MQARIPDDIILEILSYLDSASSLAMHFVSRYLRELVASQPISLYLPTYENHNVIKKHLLFFPMPKKLPRQLYLSEEVAKEKILNIESVKGFFEVRLSGKKIDLAALHKRGTTSYCGAISDKHIKMLRRVK